MNALDYGMVAMSLISIVLMPQAIFRSNLPRFTAWLLAIAWTLLCVSNIYAGIS